jgi:hypothetical protein
MRPHAALAFVALLALGSPARADDSQQQQYEVKLKDLERRVEELKEQIRNMGRRHPMPLVFFPYTVAISDRVGSGLRLVEARAWLGSELVLFASDERGLPRQLGMRDSAIVAGDMALEVELTYKGDDPIFVYMSAFRTTVRAKELVHLTPGANTVLSVEAHEQGDATTPVLERPAIRIVSR